MSNQEKIAKFIRDYHNSKNGIREILQNKKISDLETEDIKITLEEESTEESKEIEDNSLEETDVKEDNDIESTQVLPKIKNENYLNEEDIDKTQVIDMSNVNGETEATSNIENIKDIIKKEEDNLGKDTMVLDTEKIKVSEETRIVDKRDDKESSIAVEETDEEAIKPEEKQSEEIIDSIKKSEEEFTSFAESLLSSKIDSQSTQIIDTKIIREKLAEDENSEKTPEFEEMYKKTFGVEPFSVRKENRLTLSTGFPWVSNPLPTGLSFPGSCGTRKSSYMVKAPESGQEHTRKTSRGILCRWSTIPVRSERSIKS